MIPKVSVFMVTYNHEQFISQAIESVLNQITNFDFELVIAEDCSIDKTRDIVSQYKEKYPNVIKLELNKVNIGAQKNFAKITSICTGEYVAILDGDDYWTDPNKLQKQVDFLDKNQNCIMAWHEITVFSEYNLFDSYTSHSHSLYKNILPLKYLILGNYVPTVSLLFRNNVIKCMPSWYYKLPMGDYPLTLLLGHQGLIGYVQGNMAARRHHLGGIWSMKTEEYKIRNLEKYVLTDLHFNQDTFYFYDEYIQFSIFNRLVELEEEYRKTNHPKLKLILEILQIQRKNIKFKREFSNRKKVIFGTGKASQTLLLRLLTLDEYVECYIDNNKMNLGMLNGIPVEAPKHLGKFDKNNTLIMVASMYFSEISKQLSEFGFIENVHFINATDISTFLEIYGDKLNSSTLERKLFDLVDV